jgi:hypothetical protein
LFSKFKLLSSSAQRIFTPSRPTPCLFRDPASAQWWLTRTSRSADAPSFRWVFTQTMLHLSARYARQARPSRPPKGPFVFDTNTLLENEGALAGTTSRFDAIVEGIQLATGQHGTLKQAILARSSQEAFLPLQRRRMPGYRQAAREGNDTHIRTLHLKKCSDICNVFVF